MTSVLSPRCERLVGLLACAVGVSCGSAEPAAPGGPPSYTLLSETGLYSDPGALVLSGEVQAFTPAFALWSDGADKSRWVALPPGSTIDTSDMNRWLLPLGTRLWKEFALGGVRLETRLIERYGPEPGDYFMGSFVWNEDQSDAVLSEAGQENLLGTQHDAPAQERCPACHNGEPGRSLGFSALQLGAALRAGQHGHVYVEIAPTERGSGLTILDKVVGGSIPRQFIGSVKAGIKEAARNGLLGGYPVVDLSVAIVDGSSHSVDSNDLAFRLAGILAFKDAVAKAHPVLLEPIMAVECVTPSDYQGDLVGDLNRRRGIVREVSARPDAVVIAAEVPLANMFGYANAIRSLSKGRAEYTMEMAHFAIVPGDLAAKAIAK